MKTVWEKKYTIIEFGKLYKTYEKKCFMGEYGITTLSRLDITDPSDVEQVEIIFKENKKYIVHVYHKDKSKGNQGCTGQWYSYEDGNFGSFLWDKYGEKGEDKMANINWNMDKGVTAVAYKTNTDVSNITACDSAAAAAYGR